MSLLKWLGVVLLCYWVIVEDLSVFKKKKKKSWALNLNLFLEIFLYPHGIGEMLSIDSNWGPFGGGAVRSVLLRM